MLGFLVKKSTKWTRSFLTKEKKQQFKAIESEIQNLCPHLNKTLVEIDAQNKLYDKLYRGDQSSNQAKGLRHYIMNLEGSARHNMYIISDYGSGALKTRNPSSHMTLGEEYLEYRFEESKRNRIRS